jgi:AraC-like DNA-binding protein
MRRQTHRAVPHLVAHAGLEAVTLESCQSFPRHSHDEFGVGLIAFGGHRSWSGRGQVEATAGDVISVNPGEIHDGLPMRGEARGWRMIYVRPESVCGEDIGLNDFEFARPALADPRLALAFRRLFAAVVEPGGDGLAVEQGLIALFAGLAARTPARGGAPASIARAQQLIDDDPTRNVSLAELAALVGVSRFQLVRGFRRHLGATPHAYLVQRRVRLARRLLLTGVTPAACAVEAGFADQSHLTRAFVRQYGVTPARWRAAAQG